MEKVIQINRLAFGGEGVGRCEGKVVFVPWTAPGDKVRVRVVSDHGRFERAELLEVLEKSPDRINPPCPVFGTCGGCQWQHLSYESQLKWKEEILRDSLVRIGRIENPPLLPIVPANPWNYRHRIQLKVDENGKVGFYESRSHRVVSFEECRIADPLLNQKLAEIRKEGNGFRRPFEISLNGNGTAVVKETGDGMVFSQANPGQNLRLIEAVMAFSFGNAESVFVRKKTVVELYAGFGNFTLPLAERTGQVWAVEENTEAVRLGEEAGREKGLENIEWITGTAEWGLKKLYRQKSVVDLLVLDPPRRGAREILDLVPLVRPRTIVYVSCDPVTLARDLRELVRRHYRLEKVQPVDMFPQTYHIELVAQLSLI